MNQLIKINNQDLQVKQFKGQRVITFKDIDTVHERPEGIAGRNFRNNRKHFIENIDYFVIKGEELKNFKQTENFVGSNTKEIILITETGYLMLVKSLTDDLAWKVQRELVNNYFKVDNSQKLINEFKGQIATLVNDVIGNELSEAREYYKIKSSTKYDISNYIKRRLGILRADEEYEQVKARVFLLLGIGKWEDISIDEYRTMLPVIDESIRIIKLDRSQQTTFFD